MTQFEEHMIDIYWRPRKKMWWLFGIMWKGHGSATLNLVQAEETDPLEKLPGVPQGACAEALRAIVRPEMGRFSMFIYGCILGNLFTMAINPLHAESTNGKWLKPRHIAQTISVLNMFFTWVFILEALIKLACLGVAGYFYDGYNCFDFVLVLFSCLDVMAEIALGTAGKSGNVMFSGGFLTCYGWCGCVACCACCG